MPSQTRKKVLVAMSGGVDSSVAAALLVDQGYDVVGCFMRLGSPGEALDEGLEAFDPTSDGHEGVTCDPARIKIGHQGCCSINDAADARHVAARLGVPFYVCNFKKDFGRIIDYFIGEYNAGRTPNPCVRCNDWLKFGKLHDYARQIGASFVASGHYARIDRSGPGGPRLLRGIDRSKDQSYVLFGAPRERLCEMLLPVGGYEKSEIRRMAEDLGLPVFDKPDSQEICFVPDNDYAGLVRRRSPDAFDRGSIVDLDGRQIGEHEGQQHYTVGQRRGLNLALGYPIYVVGRDAATNTVTVGPREALLSRGLVAKDVNWLVDPEPTEDDWQPCLARIRYNATPVPAQVRMVCEAGGTRQLHVQFEAAQTAVAPGQAVVCYGRDEPDLVLGGGWIDQAVREWTPQGA